MTPTRPALRYLGGKWLLAPWILEHLPPHRIYCEAFGGAASVLLRKPPAYSEVYNDLDGDVVNLFRVLRDPGSAARLIRGIDLTPYAREEFFAAYELAEDPVERARRLITRSFMGHGNIAARIDRTTGFRADTNRNGSTASRDWANYPPALALIADRFRGVVIESDDALTCMRRHDRVDTLHYVDPPYVHETRGRAGGGKAVNGVAPSAGYKHEMTNAQHSELLAGLRELKGMVVLSGYHTPLYDDALADWPRVERQARADGARVRTEVLWLSPSAARALDRPLVRHLPFGD